MKWATYLFLRWLDGHARSRHRRHAAEFRQSEWFKGASADDAIYAQRRADMA